MSLMWLQDDRYSTSTLHGVYVCTPELLLTLAVHTAYPQRNGQTQLTGVTGNMVTRWVVYPPTDWQILCDINTQL